MNCYKIIQRQHCIKLLTGPIRKICPTSIEAVWRSCLFPDSNLPTLIGINNWTHVLCPNLYSRTDQEGTGLCRMHQCNVQWSPQMGRRDRLRPRPRNATHFRHRPLCGHQGLQSAIYAVLYSWPTGSVHDSLIQFLQPFARARNHPYFMKLQTYFSLSSWRASISRHIHNTSSSNTDQTSGPAQKFRYYI